MNPADFPGNIGLYRNKYQFIACLWNCFSAYFSQYRYNIIASPSKRLGLAPGRRNVSRRSAPVPVHICPEIAETYIFTLYKIHGGTDMSEPLLNVKISPWMWKKNPFCTESTTINKGETHVLMGPNGAGKSTLRMYLNGKPELPRHGR